ncbi:unnamed protein product, partial [Tenebrio molitor]
HRLQRTISGVNDFFCQEYFFLELTNESSPGFLSATRWFLL